MDADADVPLRSDLDPSFLRLVLTSTGTSTARGLLGEVLRLSGRGTWTRWYRYLSARCAMC